MGASAANPGNARRSAPGAGFGGAGHSGGGDRTDHPRPDDGQLTALLDRLLGNQPQPPRPSQNAGAAAPPNAGPANEYVRVSATHLDDLIRTSSQMAAATALSAADHQIDAHAENLAEAARARWSPAAPRLRRLRS